MNYWLDLFTGATWQEFQDSGAAVSGFSDRMRKSVARIKPGDVLLCYMTGVMRWVGALEVLGPSKETKRIWKVSDFPARLAVKPVIMLTPEAGVPMELLEGKVSFYKSKSQRGKFDGFVRMSPNLFKNQQDAEFIVSRLQEAAKTPVLRPVDAKKLARIPFFSADRQDGKGKIQAVVTVPGAEETSTQVEGDQGATTRHTEIQYELLSLGAQMGFEVWVARNDRKRMWKGKTLGSMEGMVEKMPTQFNEATNKTVELIDVLWLKGNSIEAAFEVECTTSVYSGLLRMSDLLALQPNLKIELFLVAPDERRAKVKQEIMRPTFSLRNKPLADNCGFIGFDAFTKKIEGIRNLGITTSLKPDFLKQTAEYFKPEATS